MLLNRFSIGFFLSLNVVVNSFVPVFATVARGKKRIH